MNISLPDDLKDWVEKQSGGEFATSSDYVRDLIRRDLRRAGGVARLQAEIDKGRAGPFRQLKTDELVAEITQRTKASLKADDAT
jgi:antitoxin ParD1/3/4